MHLKHSRKHIKHSSVYCGPRKQDVCKRSEYIATNLRFSCIHSYVMFSPNGTKFTKELASMKGRPHSKFESDLTHTAKSNFCHVYTVNCFEELAKNSYVSRLNVGGVPLVVRNGSSKRQHRYEA